MSSSKRAKSVPVGSDIGPPPLPPDLSVPPPLPPSADDWIPAPPPDEGSPPPPPPDDDEWSADIPPPLPPPSVVVATIPSYVTPRVVVRPMSFGPGDIPPPPAFDGIPPPPSPGNGSSDGSPATSSKASRKRKAIATEILDTEVTYYNQLNSIVSLFLKPLESDFGLTHEDIYSLFSNIEVIWKCHSKFLETIRSRLANWTDSSCIGDVFATNTTWIKLYKYYVNNYDASARLLLKLRKTNQKLINYLKLLEYKPAMSGLNLESILVVPVQRIPRYVLLLQDMVKSTPEDHPDYAPLTDALKQIKEIADYINEHKHVSDRLCQLEEIKGRIKDLPFELAVVERDFIKEGTLILNKEKRKVWLFNDVAVIAASDAKKGRHKYIGQISLKTAAMQVEDDSIKIASTEGIIKVQGTSAAELEEWAKVLDESLEAARNTLIRSAFSGNVSSQTEGSAKFLELQEQQYEKKRQELLRRLASSEREYVDFLNRLDEKFIRPVKEIAEPPTPIITGGQAQTMVSNLETIVASHAEFVQDLPDTVDMKQAIDLFEEKASFLRAYGHYVSHHADQVQAVETAVSTNQTFLEWLKHAGFGGGAELKKQLEVPLKRVPEYYLLMQEMELNTSRKHPDFEALHRVVVMLCTLTDDLTKKSSESKSQTLTGAGSLRRHSFVSRTMSSQSFKKPK